jgi:hypothetical protein
MADTEVEKVCASKGEEETIDEVEKNIMDVRLDVLQPVK